MPDTERTKLVGHLPIPQTGTGGGCLVLFSLPFIAVGAGVILLSLGYVHLGHSRSQDAPPWVLTAFGAVFATAGLGLAWSGIAGMLRAGAARKRKEEHPLEPWYWDHPWDSKGAESGGIGPAIQSFLGFLFFGAFLSMFNWWAFGSDEGPLPVKIIVSLFDLIAVAILLGAFYQLFQYLKYGKSRLHFARFPFRPGNSIEAGLLANRRLASAPSISITLRYIEEVTETHNTRQGSRSSTTTSQVHYCLHEVKQEISPRQFDAGADVEIPINIRLPAGDYANRLIETPRRYWEMEVKAETPGIDYAARFLIPVYGLS